MLKLECSPLSRALTNSNTTPVKLLGSSFTALLVLQNPHIAKLFIRDNRLLQGLDSGQPC